MERRELRDRRREMMAQQEKGCSAAMIMMQ
jgi:hypothetical protein